MRTKICERLGCDVPIFAFSHCRDVVVEVTKAGGFGVLGASTVSPEQLETELRWIDNHVDGRPYGVDVIIPVKYDEEAERVQGDMFALIPEKQKQFMETLLESEHVPLLPADEAARVRKEIVEGRGSHTPEGARRLLDVALSHEGVKLVVSALGAPPPDIVEKLRRHGVALGALCGKAAHVPRHRKAGVELLIAQGTEAGGHTGDIATMVLVPEVVEACGGEIPVLAAGGISHGGQILAAQALGAEGVWCGTIWLGTKESELDPFEKAVLFETRSEDTARRKARTGKTVRMRKSKMSEAWEQPGAPEYLLPPLQGLLYNEAHARVVRAKRKDLYSFPMGQAVGSLNEEVSVRDVMYRLQSEYVEALERINALQNFG
jgi:NAD(P)H-dependent flavin oxidoreductase YrpB (nitropropane dioxygenase family)